MTNDNKYSGMIDSLEKDKLDVVEIKFEHVMTIECLTMNFHHASMNYSINNTEVQMIDVIEIQSDLLMLPELSNDDRHNYVGRKKLYYCVGSNWCEMDQKNDMIIPESPFCVYL